MKVRIFLTFVAFVGWSVLGFITNRAAPLISGQLAGKQFDNSDISYGEAQIGLLFNGAGWPLWLLLLILVAIWWVPLRGIFKSLPPAIVLALLLAPKAYAYYDKYDYTEAFFVLPNESAFFIPDVGANRDSQVKFGSLEYYESNKVAAKRFVIPHQKLVNSGAWSDFYVPSGRLIVVDRTPYNREWTQSAQRGSSSKDESFPCQSSEGLNITLEMAVAASVTEDNASRFLYHFGVNPPAGDRSKPEVIFTSVYYGRSLREVMDTVGRGEVQTLACQEVSKHTLDQADQQMPAILTAIQEKAKAWFADYGITIDYLGWAGTFTFDPSVQKAINDRFAADKIGPVLATLQSQADIKVKEGLGAGLEKHGLPQSLVAIPTNMLESLSGLFKPATK